VAAASAHLQEATARNVSSAATCDGNTLANLRADEHSAAESAQRRGASRADDHNAGQAQGMLLRRPARPATAQIYMVS